MDVEMVVDEVSVLEVEVVSLDGVDWLMGKA